MCEYKYTYSLLSLLRWPRNNDTLGAMCPPNTGSVSNGHSPFFQ